MRLSRVFLLSAGFLLLTTSVAKLISSVGHAHILASEDPILTIPFRYLFWIVGTLELVVAMVCFFGKNLKMQAGLIAWIATSFLTYRLSLTWIGYHRPCSCLGNLTDALHIRPETADLAMKIVLAYLLVGSYVMLFWLWRQQHNMGALVSPLLKKATGSVS